MSANERSRFSRDFKLEALRQMEAGENVSVLARELGVSRKSIYQWRNRQAVAFRDTRGTVNGISCPIAGRRKPPFGTP